MIKNLRILRTNRLNIPIVFILAVIGLSLSGNTQAQNYSLERSSGTFTSIRDTGTQVDLVNRSGTSIQSSPDEGVFETIAIPFEFDLFGRRIRNLVPTTNLWLSTNTEYTCSGNTFNGTRCNAPSEVAAEGRSTSSLTDNAGGIYPYWANTAYLDGTSRVVYETSGTVGSRVLTIEFSRFANTNITPNPEGEDIISFTSPSLSVQVKLFENNSKIDFIYDRITDGAQTLRAIGLAASESFLPGDNNARYYFLDSTSNRPTASDSFVAIQPNVTPNIPADGQTYTITPDLILPQPQDITTAPNINISVVLPQARYVKGTVTYNLQVPGTESESPEPSDTLPEGFRWVPAMRTLYIEPVPETSPTMTFIYSATDNLGTPAVPGDDETDSKTFTLTVDATHTSTQTAFASLAPITEINGIVGVAIERQMPAASAGDGPFDYSFDPELPAGLSFNPRTRLIQGAPNAAQARITYNYQVFDIDRETATRPIDITVVANTMPVAPTVGNLEFIPGQAVNVSLPEFTGGNGTLTHSLTDGTNTDTNLMLGLSTLTFNPVNRMITGTIAADRDGDDNVSATTYTYTATDSNGDTTPAPFTITVVDTSPVEPTFENLEVSVNQQIQNLVLPPFTSAPITPAASSNPNGLASPELTYTLTLRNGDALSTHSSELSFNSMTREITGMPDASGTIELTYTASDRGDMTAANIDLVVVDDPRPVAPTIDNSNFVFENRQTLPLNVTLPVFTGGDGPLDYAILDENGQETTTLIGGLSFTANTLRIAGTVSITDTAGDDGDSATYTYRATETGVTEPDSAFTTFTITIEDDFPRFSRTASNIRATDGRPFSFNPRLPGATGGRGELSYSLPLQPISGLTFNGNSRVLSGIPVAPEGFFGDPGLIGSTPYTYTVTDEDGDTDSRSFTFSLIKNFTPAFPTDSDETFTLTFGDTVTNASFPGLAIRGNVPLRDNITPETFPTEWSWLTVGAAAGGVADLPGPRVFSGTVPEDTADDQSANLTVTRRIRDNDGEDASVTFTFSVIDPMPTIPSATIPRINFILDGADQSVTLPVFNTNVDDDPDRTTGTLMYTLTVPEGTTFPSGLTFTAADRTLSGTPDTPGPTTLTYTATEAGSGDSASVSVFVTVGVDIPPVAPTTPQNFPFTVGQERTVVLAAFTGGNGNLTYSIDTSVSPLPVAPHNFSFNAETRELTGTFADTAGDQGNADSPLSITYLAEDTDGDVASTTFAITIVDPVPQAPQGPQAFVFAPGETIDPTTNGNGGLATFGGGDGTLTYALVTPPDLPAGVGLSTEPLGLTGAIAADSDIDNSVALKTYTYTATDTGGDVAEATFTIQIIDPIPVAPDPVVANFIFTQGQAVSSVLPVFTTTVDNNPDVDAPTLTYSITNESDLPVGLMFTANTRTLEGTPTVLTNNPIPITYRADDGQDAVDTTFNITVSANAQPQRPRLMNLVLFPRQVLPRTGVGRVQLPEFTISNENFNLSYDLSDVDGVINNASNPLIGGLMYDADPESRTIYGTVAGDSSAVNNVAATTYTYTASSDNGTPGNIMDDVEITVSFTIEIVDERPALSGPIAEISAIVNSPINAVTLPESATGSGMITYALTGAGAVSLPRGLTFNPSDRMLSGTPSQVLSPTEFTYTATDADGESAMLTFDITVEADRPPVAPASISNLVFEPSDAVDVTLARFTGGNGELTYSLSDGTNTDTNLRFGLTFNPNSRMITGNIPADTGGDDSVIATSFTYTATDAENTETAIGDDEVSITFTIAVVDARPVAPTMTAPVEFADGEAGTNQLPQFTTTVDNNDDVTAPDLTYSIENEAALPPGITFNSATRELSGTATGVTSNDIMLTYRADEDDGMDFAEVIVTLRVVNDPEPIVPIFPDGSDYTFVPGQMVDLTLPLFTGPQSPFTYTLTDASNMPITPSSTLIGGLTFSIAESGVTISGMIPPGNPNDNGDAGPTTYTYSATDSTAADSDPETTPTTFTITIVDDMPDLSGAAIANTNINAIAGSPITAVTLPTTTGTGTVTYRLTGPNSSPSDPDLPEGFMFNTNTRELSGTPLAPLSTNNTFTYTATDADGDTDDLTFTITVAADIPIVLPNPEIVNFWWQPGQTVEFLPLTPFTGGNGTLTHNITDADGNAVTSLVGEIPLFETSIFGGNIAPDTAGEEKVDATEYTYSATDEGGEVASVTFTAAVVDVKPVAPDSLPAVTFIPEQDIPNTRVLPQFGTGNTIPQGSGITAPAFTYTLTGAPSWLSLNPSTRVLSGPAPVAGNEFQATYTASDGADEDSVTVTFQVRANPVPELTEIDGGGYTFTAGELITPVQLDPSLSGDTPLTYRLALESSPDTAIGTELVGGLEYAPNTRTITGTPMLSTMNAEDNSYSADYTYTVTDATPDEDEIDFTITIRDTMPEFANDAEIPNITGTIDNAITSVTLPAVETPGTGATAYSITNESDLPTGLRFTTNARTLDGTPSTALEAPGNTFTYRATDTDGDFVELTFTITVAAFSPLVAPDPDVDNLYLIPGQPLLGSTIVELPVFTGGSSDLTYRIEDSDGNTVTLLVGGLTFNSSTRQIFGTVADDTDADNRDEATYTYFATDDAGNEASTEFTISVVDARPVEPVSAVDDITVRPGEAVANNTVLPAFGFGDTIPQASGISTPSLTYSLENHPAWLSLDPTSRVLSGTALNAQSVVVTYIASESDGADRATETFTLRVVPDTPFPPEIRPFTFEPGDQVAETLLPFIGDEPLMYSIDEGNDLVGGLTFTPADRTIAGTVALDTADGASASYTYTATEMEDTNPDTASTTFTITIVDEIPAFTEKSITDITAVVNSPITAVTLPEADRNSVTNELIGTGRISYELMPNVSVTIPGLSFNANTRVLSGSPSELPSSAANEFTYMAMDRDGDTATSLTFTITVEDNIDLVTPATPIGVLEFVPGQQDVSVFLPVFTGGNTPVRYSLTDGTNEIENLSYQLIAGLDYDQETREISGNIDGDTDADNDAEATYTYIATDSGGEEESVTFTIRVVDARPQPPVSDIPDVVVRSGMNIADDTELPIFEFGDTIPQDSNISPPTLAYSLADKPVWLDLDPETRELSGEAPNVASTTTTVVTYIASDDEDTAMKPFNLIIDSRPVAPTIPDGGYIFTEGENLTATPFTLPEFTFGDGTLIYSLLDDQGNALSPANMLIGDLEFFPDDRTIRGTADPDEETSVDNTHSATYMYRAVEPESADSEPEMATIMVTITITDVRPSFGDRIITDISTIANSSITPATPDTSEITLPEVLSDADRNPIGTGAITYSLMPVISDTVSGLSFNATTRVLSGTPTATISSPNNTFTYTATDAEGDSAELTFTITVIEDLTPMPPSTIDPIVFSVGEAVSSTLPAFTSGNRATPDAPLTYALMTTPALPPGIEMSKDSESRIVLSGTITDTSDPQDTTDNPVQYSYTATDADNDEVSATFTIAIEDSIPVAPAGQPQRFTFSPGDTVDSTNGTLNPFTEGNRAAPPNNDLTYTFTGTQTLMENFGLSLNTETLELEGAIAPDTAGNESVPADENDSPISFTYTATDLGGDSATATFTVRIVDAKPVLPVVAEPQAFFVTVGEEATVTLAAFTGGDGSLSYAINTTARDLPNDLMLGTVADIPVITGTITDTVNDDGDSTPLTYTYTATDSGGDSASDTFTIQVVDVRPVAPNSLPSVTFSENDNIASGRELPAFDPAPIPQGSGITAPDFTYTLTGTNPPDWLSLHPDTRVLSGGPTPAAGAPFDLTYTASEGENRDSDSVTVTFQVVDDPMPELEEVEGGGYTFKAGEEINPTVQLPQSLNGDDPLVYRLALASSSDVPIGTELIGGLMYVPGTQTISGTPMLTTMNAEDNTFSEDYTYTVTDNDMDNDDIDFTITIEDTMPDLSGETIAANIPGIVNTPITTVTLPTTTGTGTITYTLTGPNSTSTDPDLPDGLTFNSNDRTLSGTPTAPLSTNNIFTYTATDMDGDTDNRTFTITVVADRIPMVPTPSIEPIVLIPGQDLTATPIELPEFSPGNATLTYALGSTPALPTGLTFHAGSREIRGTVTADTTADEEFRPETYMYIATDPENTPTAIGDDIVTTTFTLQIVDVRPESPVGSTEVIPVEFIVGMEKTETLPDFDDNIPTGLSSDPTYTFTYTLTTDDTLPTGIEISSDGRTLSGMSSTTTANPIILTYTATEDGGADTASATVSLTVTDNPTPMRPTIPNGGYTFTVGQAETPDETLPPFIFSGQSSSLDYSLTDDAGVLIDNDTNPLIGELLYDQNSRQITGAIGNDGDSETYIYTATDTTDDEEDSVMFTITIIDAMPAFASGEDIDDISGTVNSAIEAVSLPVVETAGTTTTQHPAAVYSFRSGGSTAELPAGLELNSARDMIVGIPTASLPRTTYEYIATDADGDTVAIEFFITIESDVDTPPVAPTVPNFTFAAGQALANPIELPDFTGGNGALNYTLSDADGDEIDNDTNSLVGGLMYNSDTRVITGPVADTPANNNEAETYTYTATDSDEENPDSVSITFTITITDDSLVEPSVVNLSYSPGDKVSVILNAFTGSSGNITHTLALSSALDMNVTTLVGGLTFTSTTRTIAGDVDDDAGNILPTEYTYTGTADDTGETASTTFTIAITDVPTLEMATASAIPTVGANIALVASQAISSRVELALDGLSSGIDISNLDGTQFRLNPQQQNGDSSGSPVRFGVWFSAASDSLSDTRSTVTWEGTTDSTNLGFDVGFDISESASLVVGILQNSSSTSATYRNTEVTDSNNTGTLSVDLDSTAFYVGLGYDWLDAWFASGSADSTLNDSVTMMAIPASFSYQTIGLTASFEVAESFSIGAKVESLTSDLSLAAMADDNYEGLSTDSSQLRTALVANYKLKLGENGNGLLIPKFEFGFRDLSLGSSIQENFTAAGGSAMETGFGIDYLQRAWGLTLGLDIRSISVENYSSDSTQYQIRWESGNYASGLSFQLTPHSVSETLGGIDSLYSGDYNQYQSVLERQRGGSSTEDSKGLDFEVGYGFVANYGTVTPYLKTTNYRGSGNQAEEFGIRYQTLQGLELTVKAERNLTPQTIQILGFPLTFMQQENALTLSTRYSF